MVALHLGLAEALAVTPEDRVLQFGALTFDLSALEILYMQSRGLTLVLREEAMIDPGLLMRRIEAWSITILGLPTVMWHEITKYLVCQWPPSCRNCLRCVFLWRRSGPDTFPRTLVTTGW